MNLLRVSWKNVFAKPLSATLSVILFALGIGLIVLLIIFNHQLKENFDRNLAGIDLVIGAKGSPLQMILSSMYHIDAPTGNIKVGDARAFLNPKHPLLKASVPLSLGDSYGGFRIVGTTHSFLDLYSTEIADGKIWERTFDVTIGSTVAAARGLKIGDSFQSTHGFIDDDALAHEHETDFVVVGIFKPSGSVVDRLILTGFESIWEVHGHAEEPADTANHIATNHNHGQANHVEDLLGHPEESITSILVQYKSRTNIQALNLLRNINENTGLQAASPAIEMNRLYSLVGVGTDTLRNIAIIIAIVSALSIFISLFNALKDRKYELALMRVMGGSRSKLFGMITLEGLILAGIGAIVGLLAGHLGMLVTAGLLQESYGYRFDAFKFYDEEWIVLGVALLLGVLASLIPAIQGARTDIHRTLTDK